MLFAKFERCLYQKSPLIEVICQLRFPTIPSIGAEEPTAFQEAVQQDFPQFAVRQERPAPQDHRPGHSRRQGGAADPPSPTIISSPRTARGSSI